MVCMFAGATSERSDFTNIYFIQAVATKFVYVLSRVYHVIFLRHFSSHFMHISAWFIALAIKVAIRDEILVCRHAYKRENSSML